ncbi:MAG: DMT family transporter [Rubrivivax sp.]|nr:DMT family transporter [Rubrivivax sp.]
MLLATGDPARQRRIGIALVTLATMCFSVIDVCAKWLVQSLPVAEVVWLRFATHTVLMAALLAPTRGAALVRVANWPLQGLRALMLVSMTALNFAALQYLQLAEVAAIQFSVPILIALVSALVLNERIGARRWLAICGGFVGVLLVVRPGGQGFHPAIALSLLNAAIYALFNLLTRRMAASETPESMQWLSALGAVVAIAPFAVWHWQWPVGIHTWTVVLACGLAGGLGHLLVAHAHRYASAAVLGPFLYQQILYMTFWGWLVFAQVPDAFVVAGAAVVALSGLYLLWLEMKRR